MNKEIDERLTELEIRFSHQSVLVDELNEVVAECNMRIERLRCDNQILREMVKGLQPVMEESPDE